MRYATTKGTTTMKTVKFASYSHAEIKSMQTANKIHLTTEELNEASEIIEVQKLAKKLENSMTVSAMQDELVGLNMWTCFKGSIYARKSMIALRLATVQYLLG